MSEEKTEVQIQKELFYTELSTRSEPTIMGTAFDARAAIDLLVEKYVELIAAVKSA